MSGQNSPIRIVSAADEAYVVPLGVMLCSVFENKNAADVIEVYILQEEGGISQSAQAELSVLAEKYDQCKVYFKILDISAYERLHVNIDYINPVTYYRFSLDALFDPKIDRLLYLDCDMIIQTDIRKLWETDLKGLPLGAVEDGAMMEPTTKWAKSLKLKLRFSQNSKYFNAGVLLIDMVKWREENISAKCMQLLIDYPEIITLNDQDALNFILKDRWVQIPVHWNTTTFLFTDRHRFMNKKIKLALKSPSIIHYTTGNKPWFTHMHHPAQDFFIKYWEKSPWYPKPLNTNSGQIQQGVSLISVCTSHKHLTKAIDSWQKVPEIREIILVYPESDQQVAEIKKQFKAINLITIEVPEINNENMPALVNLAARMSSFNKLLNMYCGAQVYEQFCKVHPLKPNQFYGLRYWNDWFQNTNYMINGWYIHRKDYFRMNGMNEQIPFYESHLDLFNRLAGSGHEELRMKHNYLFSLTGSSPEKEFTTIRGISSKTLKEKMFLKTEMIKVLTHQFPWQLSNRMQDYSLTDIAENSFRAVAKGGLQFRPIDETQLAEMETNALKAYVSIYYPYMQQNPFSKSTLEEAGLEAMKDLFRYLGDPKNTIALAAKTSDEQGEMQFTLPSDASDELKEVYKSLSWKIGYRVTRVLVKLFGWTSWFKRKFPDG